MDNDLTAQKLASGQAEYAMSEYGKELSTHQMS